MSELISPQARSNAGDKYSESWNKITTPITMTKALEEYRNNRLSSLNKFANLTTSDGDDSKSRNHVITTPDGSSLADKLKPLKPGNPLYDKQKDTIDAFAKALSFNNTIDGVFKPQKDLKNAIDDLNSLIKESSTPYHPAAVASYLQDLRKTAEEGIKEQQKHEKDELSALFDPSSDSLDNIKRSMGLKDDTDIQTFKESVLAALDKSHQAELEAFNKATSNTIKALHKEANENNERIFFLSLIEKNNRRQLNEARKNRDSSKDDKENSQLSNSDIPGLATFKGIGVKDLGDIETTSGSTLQHTKGDGLFVLEIPARRSKSRIVKDFNEQALAVRASGYSSIQMTVDHKDEEYAMELGRRQYEAACRAGFDPNETPDPKDPNKKISHIKCIVNGKEISTSELFKGYGTRYKTAMESANKAKSERPEFEKGSKFYKESINKLKQGAEQKAQQRIEASSPSGPA